MSEALDIARLLAELGFDAPDTRSRARTALEVAGLTRPGKTGISVEKRPRLEEVLFERKKDEEDTGEEEGDERDDDLDLDFLERERREFYRYRFEDIQPVTPLRATPCPETGS